jgi:hypothetical protein
MAQSDQCQRFISVSPASRWRKVNMGNGLASVSTMCGDEDSLSEYEDEDRDSKHEACSDAGSEIFDTGAIELLDDDIDAAASFVDDLLSPASVREIERLHTACILKQDENKTAENTTANALAEVFNYAFNFFSNASGDIGAVPPPVLSGFNPERISEHVTLSEECVRAQYTGADKDQMYGVVFANGVAETFDAGAYFEVCVEALDHRLHPDGLAIGVTTRDPTIFDQGVEDGAMVPDSWSLGYDGSAFYNRLESFVNERLEIPWQPKHLRTGDRVGLLVHSDGLAVYQNHVLVADVQISDMPVGKPLFPFVDLMGCTLAVSVVLGASPPSRTHPCFPCLLTSGATRKKSAKMPRSN